MRKNQSNLCTYDYFVTVNVTYLPPFVSGSSCGVCVCVCICIYIYMCIYIYIYIYTHVHTHTHTHTHTLLEQVATQGKVLSGVEQV